MYLRKNDSSKRLSPFDILKVPKTEKYQYAKNIGSYYVELKAK
jgi:hypothetical protein